MLGSIKFFFVSMLVLFVVGVQAAAIERQDINATDTDWPNHAWKKASLEKPAERSIENLQDQNSINRERSNSGQGSDGENLEARDEPNADNIQEDYGIGKSDGHPWKKDLESQPEKKDRIVRVVRKKAE